jgi:hypothetical protein
MIFIVRHTFVCQVCRVNVVKETRGWPLDEPSFAAAGLYESWRDIDACSHCAQWC